MRRDERSRALRTALGVVVAAHCLGCAPDTQRPNLLLVTLDTTRADRLGCYGREGAATPNLDGLAADGALFEQAIAVAPVTLPSHVSLLTGQYPPRHGVRMNGDFRLPEGDTTLAEHLGARGYATAAIVGAYVLSADFGIAQGFPVYDEPPVQRDLGPGGIELRHEEIVERTAGEVTRAAIELLDGRLAEPFFLWLHYYDPHGEYEPPPPYAGRFSANPYEGEIAYVDAELGRVLDALRSGGRLDRTLVAVTADHGESLGEHGENTHGLLIYEATQRVPLLLRMPETVPAGTRSDRLVSGVDLAPTLLELLGQPPLPGAEGLSFAAAARGERMPPRPPVYTEAELPLRAYGWAPLRALRDERYKFIRAPQLELYDLDQDPGESRNIALGGLDRVGRFVEALAALEATWPADRPEAEQRLDPAARGRLAALGYVSGGTAPLTDGAKLPNPGQMVQVHNLLLDVQTLIAGGAFPHALELTQKALDVDPENPTALELSGTLLCNAKRCDEGLQRLLVASRLAPRSYQTQRNLGNALQLAGRLAEAAAAYRAAIALHPRGSQDHQALGQLLFSSGDLEGAISSYREAARLGLDSASLHDALGAALGAAGDGAGARAALRRAVEIDPERSDSWNRLGILSEKQGQFAEARQSYARALAAQPAHAGALFNDAKVCLRLGLLAEAAAGVARLLSAHPDYPAGRYLEAQIRLAQGDSPAARAALERFLAQKNADPRLVGPAREILAGLPRS